MLIPVLSVASRGDRRLDLCSLTLLYPNLYFSLNSVVTVWVSLAIASLISRGEIVQDFSDSVEVR
jgi:hypothetical protein